MSRSSLTLLPEDHERFQSVLERVREGANARFALLLDRNGHQVSLAGDLEAIDPAALSSLAAGNVAATSGLAELMGEEEFSSLHHEGAQASLHLSLVNHKMILLVSFDERSSLGLVRLRVQEITDELSGIIDTVHSRDGQARRAERLPLASIAEITDEDIDALFR